MPILNKPTVQMAEEMNGIKYDAYSYDRSVYKNNLYQLGCSINRTTNSDKVLLGAEGDSMPIWYKLDEDRVLLINLIQTRMTVQVNGKVIVVNQDETTRATTPFLHATPDDSVVLVDSAYFTLYSSAICKLHNQDMDKVILKLKNVFFLIEIPNKGVGNQLECTVNWDIMETLSMYYCELYGTDKDDEFIFFDFDEDSGSLSVHKYSITEDYNLITTIIGTNVLTGLTPYKLLKVIKLDKNNYYVVFSSEVSSGSSTVTNIQFYNVYVGVTVMANLVDGFTLDRKYSTISCSYNEGYVTILCGYNNVNMIVFSYFISNLNNIDEVYHINRTITQANTFTGVQGIMLNNDGLFYVTYQAEASGIGAKNTIGMKIMGDKLKAYTSASISGNPQYYQTSPPIICYNNVYFIYSMVAGDMNIYCHAFFTEPVLKPFYLYNNLFGICEKSVSADKQTSILYPQP